MFEREIWIRKAGSPKELKARLDVDRDVLGIARYIGSSSIKLSILEKYYTKVE